MVFVAVVIIENSNMGNDTSTATLRLCLFQLVMRQVSSRFVVVYMSSSEKSQSE